jgi:hypothetical protein
MKRNYLCGSIALIFMTMTAWSAPSYGSEPLTLGSSTSLLENVPIIFNGTSETVLTGGIQASLNNGLSQVFFCYDLSHTINVGGNYFVNLQSPNFSNPPSYLLLPPAFNLEVAASLMNNANFGSFTSVDQYAALQLAMWTILYDWNQGSPSSFITTLGTNTTEFSALTVTGNLLSEAQNFLTQALGYTSDPNSYGGVQLLINANDSQESVIQTIGGITTPEPKTYLILGSCLAFVLAFKRQRLNQKG